MSHFLASHKSSNICNVIFALNPAGDSWGLNALESRSTNLLQITDLQNYNCYVSASNVAVISNDCYTVSFKEMVFNEREFWEAQQSKEFWLRNASDIIIMKLVSIDV
jgi:hypothetical protein